MKKRSAETSLAGMVVLVLAALVFAGCPGADQNDPPLPPVQQISSLVIGIEAPYAPEAPEPLPPLAVKDDVTVDNGTIESLAWYKGESAAGAFAEYASVYEAVLVVTADADHTFAGLDESGVTCGAASDITVTVTDEGSRVSIVLTFPETRAAPAIQIGAQSGTALKNGEAGEASYLVTVTSIKDGTYSPALAWYTDNNGSGAAAVETITLQYAALILQEAGGTLVLSATDAAAAGNYYFSIAFAGAVSGIQLLNVANSIVSVVFDLPDDQTIDLELNEDDIDGRTFTWETPSVTVSFPGDLYSDEQWYLDGDPFMPPAGVNTITLVPQDIGIGTHTLSFTGALISDGKVYGRTVRFTIADSGE
ncbi:MAG: hypothetical protein LBR16_07125 [Treponema sp.]|nr:hypothetical protein [Treponema sp.]